MKKVQTRWQARESVMRHHLTSLIVMAALGLAGCGGSVPGLSPLGNSLTDGLNGTARTQTSRARQIVQRSPWDVSALRNRAPKPKFSPERTVAVGNKSVVIREVTFETEPVPGTSLSLFGY